MTDLGRVRRQPGVWRHDWYPLTRLRQALVTAVAAHGLSRPGTRVVDLGCGDRPYAPLFISAGCEYVGCDIDGAPDVHIVPGRQVDLPDGSADVVVSFQVLEHVWDLDWYLGECRRLVANGGRLLLSTHGTWPYHPHPTDFRRWTRDGLQREITERGFIVEEMTPIVGPLAWTTHFRLLGYREALRRVPVLGPLTLPPLALAMNLRTAVEDAITPTAIRDGNAAVYVTVSRRSPECKS